MIKRLHETATPEMFVDILADLILANFCPNFLFRCLFSIKYEIFPLLTKSKRRHETAKMDKLYEMDKFY